MTTTPDQPLRPFQKKVRDLVLQGKNIILQAPTGSGKTRAALSAYVDNLKHSGSALPLSCIYATPLRVLANQFYQDYAPLIAYIDKKRGTDYIRRYQQLGKTPVAIQTGEQPADPQFESLMTFCTIDQPLASVLGTPYGLGGRRANLNVGAVLGSYLVLDEFHLYPLTNETSCYGARTTTLALLALLQGITPFVLMTATFSTHLLKQLGQLLNAEIVTIEDEDELHLLAQERQRFFEVAAGPLSAASILAHHEQCSLVICNTVLRAQQRYWELKELAQARGIEVVLLHSRLTAQDRAGRSEMVMRELGPAPRQWSNTERYGWRAGRYYGKNLILVATQVVEVGLDISVQTLHTEIAPANSLIQRAGRCARFAKQHGRVIVYNLSKTDDEKPVSTRPYAKHSCDATLAALNDLDLSQPLGFREEQNLIDIVHTQEDRELLERFVKRQDEIVKDIFTSLKDHSPSVVSRLIRDVAQVQVVIHNAPEDALREEPWLWQSFALHPESLAAHLKKFEEKPDTYGAEWVCKQAVASKMDQDEQDADSRRITFFEWPILTHKNDQHAQAKALRETILVALPYQLASYHPELGFVLRDDWPKLPWPVYQSTLADKKRAKLDYKPITEQSYQQHISGLVSAYNTDIALHMTYVIQKLEKQLALVPGSIDHAIRLAIACHDLGKLTVQWQQWAWEWQTLLFERMGWQSYTQNANFFFAKTDFDSKDPNQRIWQHDTKTSRPNHACESVALGLSLLAHSLGIKPTSADLPLLRATCGAIARHHTPKADDYNAFQLKPGAIKAIQEALELTRQGQPWSYNCALIKTGPIKSGQLLPETGARITLPHRPAARPKASPGNLALLRHRPRPAPRRPACRQLSLTTINKVGSAIDLQPPLAPPDSRRVGC